MDANPDREDQFLVTFADVLSLFHQFKKTMIFWALILGVVGMLAALIKPIRYQSEGTFRERGIKSNNVGTSSVLQFLSAGLSSSESEAASLMTSRKILKDVIENLHLQASLEPVEEIETYPKLIKKNLQLAWNAWMNPLHPILKEVCCPLKIDSLEYTGEIPLTFLLDFQQDGSYEVRDLGNSKQSVGKGKLGEFFQFKQLSLNLVPALLNQPLLPQSYVLIVDSLTNIYKKMEFLLQVEPSKLDKSLLKLKYEHRNRHMASTIINTIMDRYQKYLKNYHQDVAIQQLDYLGLRRDQLRDNLVNVMQKHANFLAHDLYSSGFIESDKEMDFLAESQHEYKQKLLDNELEIKRLENVQTKPNHFAYFDSYTNEGDSVIINNIYSETRALKQRRDALEIELQKKAGQQGIDFQKSFEQQFNEFKKVQLYLVEIGEIISQFQKGILPDADLKLLNDPRFLLKEWFERLQHSESGQSKNHKEMQESFQFYLNNLQRLFEVHERILQERLVHQQNPSEEYQGISLEVATELYLDYSKQLIRMEADIRQNLFFIHQIEDPHFEITSLSAGLEDSVSSEMIHKASQLILNLRDQNNQSMREQERIKEELQLQRTFLMMHLKQMVQLMELNKQLIDEKIFALQNVSLELVHQRISLLEKNLEDYLQSRLDNLQQERTLIKRHLEHIHLEMALLPQKWVSEQLLKQEVNTNQLIVEEIAKLVESKNISHKLDVIQSAPIDLAIPSLNPLTPKVFSWGALGFVLGGSLSFFFILGKSFYQGIKASTKNLEMMGHHVSGRWMTSKDLMAQQENTRTLHRLQLHFDHKKMSNHQEMKNQSPQKHKAKLLLLIEGQRPHFTPDLADGLLKKGQRVITLDFRTTEHNLTSPGFSEYLKGDISIPPIQKGEHGDWIAAGINVNPFPVELMGSSLFCNLTEKLAPHYDWILVASNIRPSSIDAESLLPLFSNVAIILEEETIEKLSFYTDFLKHHPDHRLTFILT